MSYLYRPLVRAPQSDSLSLFASLPLPPSRELSPASVTSCAWAGAFFKFKLVRRPAGGRADEALPYTAPGGPGRPATIDSLSAALQPPVDVLTPSRSSLSSAAAAGGDLQPE